MLTRILSQPWPLVERFLNEQRHGSIGVDVGCGNGKYLAVNNNVFIIGSDRSTNLTCIAAQHQPHSAVVADVLELPHPPSIFDFALSIAVIHHLSTRERRVAAITSTLDILKPPSSIDTSNDCGGKALLYVWALEQASSRRGWDNGDAQDVMVPWVTKSSQLSHIKGQRRMDETEPKEKTYQRYYHLYRKGELEEDVLHAGGVVFDSGYERDNWWAIVGRN